MSGGTEPRFHEEQSLRQKRLLVLTAIPPLIMSLLTIWQVGLGHQWGKHPMTNGSMIGWTVFVWLIYLRLVTVRFVTELRAGEVSVAMRGLWRSYSVSLASVKSARPVTFDPASDWGGYGVRSTNRGRAFIAGGLAASNLSWPKAGLSWLALNDPTNWRGVSTRSYRSLSHRRDRLARMRWIFLLAATAASLAAQTAAPNDSGVSIGHMHLVVADPDAQKKLWVDVLGAQVTNAGSLEMLKLPGVFIVVQKARTAPAEGSDGSTVNHFGFLTKSYADMKAKLITAGVTNFPVDRPGQQFIAEFPEKVRVEFTQDAALKVPLTFHHIHLVATDDESLRAWYVKTFGAKAGKRGDYLAAFVPGGEVDVRKADAAAAPTKGRSLDHIGFEIKGLEAFCKNLQAQGVPFDLAYREMPQLGGMKIAFILDPIGTRIELTEGLNTH